MHKRVKAQRSSRPFVALIPARGCSKSVPRKNLRMVAGKPLLTYTIEAARGSRFVGDIYLSSDDQEILDVGAAFGVQPVRRPAHLAPDDASADGVVEDFLSTLSPAAIIEDPFLIYLQPTSPLRSSVHLDEAIESLIVAGRTSLVSVTPLEKSPFKSFILSGDGTLRSLFEERYSNFNRQELPPAFIPNGASYIFPVSEFVKRGGFPSDGSHPYVMSASESIDVDSESDLRKIDEYLGLANERI